MKRAKMLVIAGLVFALGLASEAAKADFTFGDPVNLESVIPVIDPVHESINCFSTDGLEMYIVSDRPGGQGAWDLWVLRRASIGDDWASPENLGPAVNSINDDGAASVSADGLTLSFHSSFIRLLSRWPLQVRALESSGEKNRLGRGPN